MEKTKSVSILKQFFNLIGYRIFQHSLRLFAVWQNKDKDKRADKQHARVEEVCHDFKGGELMSQFMHRGNRHEHLRAVRQDAL